MADQVFHQVDVVAPDRRCEKLLARSHPVAVALDGVDFAVVAHHPERLAERPRREGVGGETLVIKRDRDFKVRIVQVQVESAQGGRHRQRLVGNQAAGERRHVEALDLLGAVLDLAAAEVELALELVGIHPGGAGHQQMFDLRTAGEGDFAQRLDVHRHFAPADAGDAALVGHFGGQRFDRGDCLRVFSREKEHRHRQIGVVFQSVAQFRRCLAEQRVGDLRQHARAVTCLHVRVHRAAVCHAANRRQRVIQDLIAAFPLQMGDRAHAAVVVFLGKPVQRSGDERGA